MTVEMEISNMIDQGFDDLNQSTLYNINDISDGAISDMPSKFLWELTEIQDQGKAKYKNGCTCFGLSHVLNEMAGSMKTLGDILWQYAVEHKTGSPKNGWGMALALAMGKELKHLEGYASVKGVSQMKSRIKNNGPIYIGANKIDWMATYKKGKDVAVIGKGSGHIFSFVGWDDNFSDGDGRTGAFIMRDNYAKRFWNDGLLHVMYDDVDSLYTPITVTTSQESAAMKAVKDEQAIQKTLSDGIMKQGIDMSNNVTRSHVAIVIGRLKYGIQDDEGTIQQTITDKIWSGKREDENATREEMLIMFARYLGIQGATDSITVQNMVKGGYSSGLNLTSSVTREQLAIITGRILLSKKN